MPVARKQVGDVHRYRGYEIRVRECQPCLVAEVDSTELSGFFSSVDAVRKAGERYVDDKIEANKRKV